MISTKFLCAFALYALFLATLLSIVPITTCDDAALIPADKSALGSWFASNVKPYTSRKDTLDPQLVAAEEAATVIKVRKDGKGDFKTITDAVKSIPSGNKKRVIVWIGAGTYTEKITIPRDKPFVTFYGNPKKMPTLVYSGTALQYGTVDSATLIVMSDYFVAANLLITNSAPKPDGVRKGAQAVSMRQSGDKAAFYNCKFIGFQDTICDDRGKHFFKDCYIEGTVDFIFGSGTSLYLNTELRVVEEQGSLSVITAQARESDTEETGYTFVHCSITGNGKGAYLGRAWKTRPRVVFAYTDMGNVVHPQGWSDNFHLDRDKTVFFGEYKSVGEGADKGTRAKFTKGLTDAQAKPFISLGFIKGSSWLLPPPQIVKGVKLNQI